jgi:predicted DNA-binding protein
MTIRLAVELRHDIERLAAKEGLTRSDMVRTLLERGLKSSRKAAARVNRP